MTAKVNKVNPALVALLRNEISGSVVAIGEETYDRQRTPWLQVIDQHPAVIVNAANVEDICVAVRTAAREGLPLGVQNTGHGIARACEGGILLRLSEMKSLSVDAQSKTAVVEPGVTSGELLGATELYGLGYASGQVSNVGVIGYTLGGGVGWIGREAGAACRAVVSATVVLADGSVVLASEKENTDLFWALKGGGGNFGVVVSLTIKLRSVPKVFGGMAYYRMADAQEVLSFYREWTGGLGNETSTTLRLMKLPPKPRYLLHGLTDACVLGVCHTDLGSAEELHRRITAFKKPVLDDLQMRLLSKMASFDEASEAKGSPTYGHLECLRELTEDVLAGVARLGHEKVPPLMQIELQQLGGELSAERDSASAYTAPRGPFFLHVVSPAFKVFLADLATATTEAFDSFGAAYTGEVSYNFLRGDQQARVLSAFSAQKYARLQMLKRRYDPKNTFHLNINIPPAPAESSRSLLPQSRLSFQPLYVSEGSLP